MNEDIVRIILQGKNTDQVLRDVCGLLEQQRQDTAAELYSIVKKTSLPQALDYIQNIIDGEEDNNI